MRVAIRPRARPGRHHHAPTPGRSEITLKHRIARTQPEESATGPPIGVAELASGRSPQERIRCVLSPDRIPANAPLVLLWRGGQLSSPDTIAAKGANRNGQGIEVQIELRRFDGPLHANFVTVPVAEFDVGSLEQGQYEVSITVTELWFSELNHPENAGRPNAQRTNFSFTVTGWSTLEQPPAATGQSVKER